MSDRNTPTGVDADPAALAEGRTEIEDTHELTPAERKSGERLVMTFFTLAMLSSIGFVVAYVFAEPERPDSAANVWLGLTLGAALLFVGIAVVVWQKRLMSHERVVEERHTFEGTAEEWEELDNTFLANSAESGVPRRKVLLGGLVGASGMLVVPAVVSLRDMGMEEGSPHKVFSKTAWAEGIILVDKETGRPIRRDTLEIGGTVSAIPDHHQVPEAHHEHPEYLELIAKANVIVMRVEPSRNRPLKGREDWAPDGFIVYSKICTHVGCPVALYEQQTDKLLCPCHQSTFDVLDGARVLFGPAARPLPQLPVKFNEKGELVAQSDFTEPVGPSFWERT